MKINRFPKMAVLQKYRALKLWYPEDLAKAIWIAEATKYAIFKNLALSKRENIEKKLISTGKVQSVKEIEQLSFDDNFKIHLKDWWPFVGWKIFKDVDYDRYFSRFWDDILERLENWAKNIIENVDKNLLKNESKFFNNVWKKVRDEEI
jgi:hypothetical protein